ncbi:MAG: hypothetical protein JWM59_20 [Verrucomicrobiales bacterium]|nr:hypothetical protein [Verrucomicrobiales bacterium]
MERSRHGRISHGRAAGSKILGELCSPRPPRLIPAPFPGLPRQQKLDPDKRWGSGGGGAAAAGPAFRGHRGSGDGGKGAGYPSAGQPLRAGDCRGARQPAGDQGRGNPAGVRDVCRKPCRSGRGRKPRSGNRRSQVPRKPSPAPVEPADSPNSRRVGDFQPHEKALGGSPGNLRFHPLGATLR